MSLSPDTIMDELRQLEARRAEAVKRIDRRAEARDARERQRLMKQQAEEARLGYRGTPPGGDPSDKPIPGAWMPYGRLPYEMLCEIEEVEA